MEELNTKRKGNITELRTMLAFMELGYNILTPYGDCERYDFVVDKGNGEFLRLQSKTSHAKDIEESSFVFCTSTNHRQQGKCINYSYTSEDIDYFVTWYNGKVYLIPVHECGGREKSLRLTPTKNGQTKGISWAKDYELEEVIKSW